MEKVQSVLEVKTCGMFTKRWYKETSKEIEGIFKEPKTDIQFKKFFESEVDNSIRYYNYEILDLFRKLNKNNKNVTPKRMTMEIKKWCKDTERFYFNFNSNGKRGFWVEKDLKLSVIEDFKVRAENIFNLIDKEYPSQKFDMFIRKYIESIIFLDTDYILDENNDFLLNKTGALKLLKEINTPQTLFLSKLLKI